MKGINIITIVACLLIGVGGGYAIGYTKYEPIVVGYENQVANLFNQISNLDQDVATLKLDVSEREGIIKTQLQDETYYKSEVSILQSKQTELKADLEEAKAEHGKVLAATLSVRSELENLHARMENLMDTTVIQNYHWTYQLTPWDWYLTIPLALYFEYTERPRPSSAEYFIELARDPNDDSYINKMVQQMNDAAVQQNYNEAQKLNFIIAFVQNLPYTRDSVTTPYDEHPRYPVETLFDRGGDCEDTSILLAALLDSMGYDVALLMLYNAEPRHMAVGVSATGIYGSYYEYGGARYYYLETVGEGWQIGQIPPSITNTIAHIYPL